jgi:hypothetical protein
MSNTSGEINYINGSRIILDQLIARR